MIGTIEITSIISSLVFTFILIYVLIPKMKIEKIYWEDYFKQVDIYQGRSHWTKIKMFLSKRTMFK